MDEVSLTICDTAGVTEEEAKLTGDDLYIRLKDEASGLILNEEPFAEPHVNIHRDGERVWLVDEDGISRMHDKPAAPLGKALLSDGDAILIGDHLITIHINGHHSASIDAAPRKAQARKNYLSSLRGRVILLAAAVLILAVVGLAGFYIMKSKPVLSLFRSLLGDIAFPVAPRDYQLEIQKVSQDRGEPVGNKAEIDVPAELKHYKDRRRFLALQVAEWRKQHYEIPHDFSELASMISRGEFISLPTLGESYLLYGVGLKANDELTHYDEETKKSVPLFSSEAELDNERGRLSDSVKELETKARELKKELDKVRKGDRSSRAGLNRQIKEGQKEAAIIKKRKDLLDSFYKNDEHRKVMVEEYATLANLARDFDGQSFDLNDADARREFKIRLLSYLRPAARNRLEEIASAYRQKFDRLLPVTSLIRTEEYQRHLGEAGNPNAIRIKVPPHTTGLAFDVFTYYMTAEEQNFLMEEIARLEREGHVEALRENRNHIHLFVFTDGTRPDESLVKKSAGDASGDD
jgi:hypothetical protein